MAAGNSLGGGFQRREVGDVGNFQCLVSRLSAPETLSASGDREVSAAGGPPGTRGAVVGWGAGVVVEEEAGDDVV